MRAARLAMLLLFATKASHAAGPGSATAPPPCPASRAPAYAPWVFLGYACAGDCLDHKRGFAAAERAGIADPAACHEPEPRVEEGCRAYAEGAVTSELAGFEWARENEIGTACACAGAGEGFEAGCRAYVETRAD